MYFILHPDTVLVNALGLLMKSLTLLGKKKATSNDINIIMGQSRLNLGLFQCPFTKFHFIEWRWLNSRFKDAIIKNSDFMNYL